MSEDLKVIKDLSWVKISQDKNERNVFYLTFNIPSYESSVDEPLPRNTALFYEPLPIGFWCELVQFVPRGKSTTTGVVQIFCEALAEVCDFLEKQIRQELKKIPTIDYFEGGFCGDYSALGGLFYGKFPTKSGGWFKSWIAVHFDPPLDSEGASKVLHNIDEIYATQIVPETKELLREQLDNVGFVLGNYSVFLDEDRRSSYLLKFPKFNIFTSINFYYLPRTLDEWKGREISPLRFKIILPWSKEVVDSFVDVISSCETVTELSIEVLFYISMFRDRTRVIYLKHPTWSDIRLWLICREMNTVNRTSYWDDDYPFLEEVFTWVRRIVEGSSPFQTEELTNGNNPIGNEVSP